MRMLIAVITHNRLEYTKRCLAALKQAIDNSPSSVIEESMIVVVDNASDDGTKEWLHEEGHDMYDYFIPRPMNSFPGAACNLGWMRGLDHIDATHLMRLDNDCVLSPGAFTHINNLFDSFDGMGQLGLIEMSDAEEFRYVERINDVTGARLNTGPTNIGGPCVISREVWDRGVRYSEMPWQNFGGPTPQEDVKLSLDIKGLGLFFGNTCDVICTELSFGNTDDYYDYYVRTFQQRGHGVPARTKDGEVISEGTAGKRDHI